ncbi:MAG: two-component regulator propeller domain-containing protein [Pseudomonadota bacterium]
MPSRVGAKLHRTETTTPAAVTGALKSFVFAALTLFAMTVGVSAEEAAATANDLNAPALVPAKMRKFTDRAIPHFKVDAAWPTMPDDYVLGQVSGLAVDGEDNVWLLQRPNSLRFSDTGADQNPPIAICCKAAPHVMQFSPAGRYLQGWGGPSITPRINGRPVWPETVHGLFADSDGTIWIGGNGDDDHAVLNFTADGTFIRAVGQRGRTDGNFSTEFLGNPADIDRDPKTGALLIADGYINKRVVAADGQGNIKRIWGAYGVTPDGETRAGAFDQSQASSTADGGANPSSRQFGDIVHCVVGGPRGRIYVCDRRNNRIQVFESVARPKAEGESASITFLQDIVIAPATGGTRTVSDVAFSPDGTFMYVADMMNGQVWILDAQTYEPLGAVGRNGTYPGQFIWLHSVAADSRGDIYTAEVATGRRVQKFVFDGVR